MHIYRFFVFLIIIILFWSCSTNTQYQILSFFFDGVPNPQDTTKIESLANTADTLKKNSPLTVSRVRKPIYNLHSPYQDRSCSDCHNTEGSNRLVVKEPDLCYECHDDFNDEFDFLHGPVASGYCTACHNPHMSKNEKLLNYSKRDLCIFCHEQKQVFLNDVHEGIELSECLDCHNPHGGEDKYILY